MSARRPPVLLGRAGERQLLDGLLDGVRGGRSAALVIHGEAGAGKTALLHHCARQASGFRVARIAGIESEMELPFAALHQLCAPALDRLGALPEPQRAALGVALGLASGAAPDRFLVGLATLSLLAELAGERPLLCLVDDAQWLDPASAQVLGFVARRLPAEALAMVFAAREGSGERAGLPELTLGGLADAEARALLASVIPGPLDERVRDRLVAETHGNPLAILELPLEAAQLPDGFGSPPGQIEPSLGRELDGLPADARRLLLVAAAEPVGDPLLVWRAAEGLGLAPAAAAGTEGWLALGERVTFRHPRGRAAVYRSARLEERVAVHVALAEATDPDTDPDRRAWHLAQASMAPDEPVARELERSAARAQARGGLAAAAAFRQRAATLSPDPSRRAARRLAAAVTKRDAGKPDAALTLLGALDPEALDELGRAHADLLRGEIALDQFRAREAVRLLAGAARRLETLAPATARRAHLEALGAAMWAGDGVRRVAEAALRAPPPPGPPTASDALLDAFALLPTKGLQAAAPALHRGLGLVLAQHAARDDREHWLWFAVAGNALTVAMELWDADAWRAVALHHERFGREAGALVRLQFALNMRAWIQVIAGEPAKATRLLDEGRALAAATGNPPIDYAAIVLAAWRGEGAAAELIAATARDASARGLGRIGAVAAYASAVLHNGLGRHAEARAAARAAFDADHAGLGPFLVPELAEAAARTGDRAALASLRDWLGERTRVTRSEWALATEARVRASLSTGSAAESAHREAIDRLRRTWLRPELGRAHLLFGEWLRREGRRVDAREQLRTAQELFAASGAEAFAERARRELAATGETARRRTAEARDELTPQETEIAGLARDGLSNPAIAARLFLSPRTVEWHLKKVFTKLGISSRMGLHDALPTRDPEATHA